MIPALLRSKGLVLLPVLLAMLSAGSGATRVVAADAAGSSRVRTLVTTRRPIIAFAQDDNILAWATYGRSSCPELRMRDLRTGRETVVDRWGDDDCTDEYDVLAVSGSRFVLGWMGACCNNGYGAVDTGGIGLPARSVEPDLYEDYHAYGDFIVGANGGDGALVYAVTKIGETNPDDSDRPGSCSYDPNNCTFRVTDGRIARVDGGRVALVPNTEPAAMIALAGRRLAIVPADRSRMSSNLSSVVWADSRPHLRPAAGASVEIVDAVTGHRLASFRPAGRIEALSLSERIAVVLVTAQGGTWVEIYDAGSGALVRRFQLASSGASELTVSGNQIVYTVGRKIRLVGAPTGAPTTIVTASNRPSELSLVGDRLSWVESSRARGLSRVRSLLLR